MKSQNLWNVFKRHSFQLIFLLCLNCYAVSAQTTEPIVISSQSLNIPGIMAVSAWQSKNANQEFDYPKMYYGFAAGDELIVDFSTDNGKGTQRITVSEYESKSVVYSNNAFQKLEGIRIKIPKASVYKFEFATNHILDRQCKVSIKRVPVSDATKMFNCNVTWKTMNDTVFNTRQETVKVDTKYEAVTLQSPSNQFVNSATNIGGKTRISFPIVLPANTVEWYYSFAATRNKADVEKTKANMKLLGDLSKAIDKTGTLSFAMSMLTQPPGANYCDVYLLTEENNRAFIAKESFKDISDVSRENFMSGVVKVTNCCQQGKYFIGFRNNDLSYGIEAMIEVVAIVQKDIYETRSVKYVASVSSRQVPVFGN